MSITDFGFHLAPIGHPQSGSKLFEWRISFSIAERTLVWSFNQVQMQCYALMKIILKQFIKVKCSPQNQVLCSYFIKMFLFWTYKTTDENFWRADNLRNCMRYLLTEFSKRIREGVLRHYFIPRFNLLSVKLTPAAQRELLQLFDIVIESDISILNDCRMLRGCWQLFLLTIVRGNEEVIESIIRNRSEGDIQVNDHCMYQNFDFLYFHFDAILSYLPHSFSKLFSQILTLSCKTPLQTLMLKSFLLNVHIRSLTLQSGSGNKSAYQLQQTAQNEIYSFDISTCKLWCAMLLYMKGDYSSALDIINQVLSSIPPFALHTQVRKDAQQLYYNMFSSSNETMIQKAKKAWMFDLKFNKTETYLLPLAIKIELYLSFVDGIELSPLTCAYYLQFLCYFDLNLYDNRDRALEQLVDFVKNAAENHRGECLRSFPDLNITGHCLLLAGKMVEARDMFYLSYTLTKKCIHYSMSKTLLSGTC